MTRPASPWFVWVLCSLLSLAMGMVAGRAPVFGAGYRPVGDDWREVARTMLDPKAYALAHAAEAVRVRDGAAAMRWAETALARAPDSAWGWVMLAWGRALAGEDLPARRALEESYRLAPRSMPLAVSRAALSQRWWPELSRAERLRLLEEVRIARGLDAAEFNRMAEKAPRLAALHRLAMR